MKVVGVDPGLTGAMCGTVDGKTFETHPFKKKRVKGRNRFNIEDFVKEALTWVDNVAETTFVVEVPLAIRGRPMMTVASIWRTFGQITGALVALGVENNVKIVEVQPHTWQRWAYAGVPKKYKGKDRSFYAAKKLMKINTKLDGVADAALITKWYLEEGDAKAR